MNRGFFSSTSLRWREKLLLHLQSVLGWLFLLPISSLVVVAVRCGLRLKLEAKADLRAQFDAIVRNNKHVVICANHLTMVDSVLIMWGLASIPYYLRHYRCFSWNIPAKENYCSRVSLRVIAYLSKCIPIDRAGTPEHLENVIEKFRYLVRRKEVCLIFPEGQRSRTGRIDTTNLNYGIGKIVAGLPECKIVCIYLRGRRQRSFSVMPPRKDILSMAMKVLSPDVSANGRRGARDISRQVMQTLYEMEESFFQQNATVNR